jgi:hypothetical protein
MHCPNGHEINWPIQRIVRTSPESAITFTDISIATQTWTMSNDYALIAICPRCGVEMAPG